MPDLRRANITRATQVMLPTYCLTTLWLGLGYLLADPARFPGGAFTVVRDLAPLETWGVIFLVVGLIESGALATLERRVMVFGLCLGIGIYAVWAFCFAVAALTQPTASPNTPILFAFIALAHLASLRSLSRGEAR